MTRPVLTKPKETSQYFSITPMTLWRWRQDSSFPQPLKRGKTVLYNIDAITRWMTQEEAK